MNSTKCRESWTGPMKTDESEFGPIDERSRRLCQEFMIYNERPYSIDDCWDKCFQSEDCDAFYVDSEDQNCRLYRKGCSYSPYSPAAGEIDTFGSCLMNRVAFRQEFSWSTRTDGCFKYKVDRHRPSTKM
ncbi:Oidioi.mRNA.OKI2018_I69.XSR.g16284.t1.cds [Oikopleura dioica]|uniref:Oidioi.mRNA.OKI2018_I69.XSR.g16284.t1.cds n=1 Tax=Oikopleura dioica TaxID=34765 RepID=A0ABN7SKG9_OIKDI|nr:Oidioi.mRNA.OKI2018_I69.XSR.g16284.t1.cds [Oikopleura dioica]